VFAEPLPSNDRRDKHTHTDWWEGFMKYAAEMGSGAMIYMPSFIKVWFRHLNVIRGGGDSQTYREDGDRIMLFSFFQNFENRLKWAGNGEDKECMY
jgi:hypothetical protein